MKSLCHFAYVAILLIVTSCVNIIEHYQTDSYDNDRVDVLIDVASGQLLKEYGQEECLVSQEDVLAYVHYKELSNKDLSLQSITPEFMDDCQDPILYIVQYNRGWEILSGDKRLSPVIYECSTGVFEEQKDNLPLMSWIELSKCDIYEWRMGDYSSEVTDVICNNLNFWTIVTNPDILLSIYPRTKSLGDQPIETDVLVDIIEDFEVYDSIPHIIQTHWSQSSPFNAYCPLMSNSDTYRCPAGCTAVAGAQMLFFLHDKFGVPQYGPNYASVSGHAPDNYVMDQYNFTTSAWNLYSASDDKAAVLIAYVGKSGNMSYGDDGSGMNENNLRTYVLGPNGINSEYGDFDSDTIRFYLSVGMPLIAAADRVDELDEVHGHCFIIDRYMRYRKSTTYVYESRPVNIGNAPMPIPHRFSFTVYGEPYISKIGMNWGYGSNYDGVMYTVGGTWYPQGLESRHYDYNRRIIYGFQTE